MLSRFKIILYLCVISLVVLFGAAQVIAVDLVIGGATPGHTTYQIGVAYSEIINNIPGFSVSVETSGGGYNGIDLVMNGDIDGASTGLMGTLEKYEGVGVYEGKKDEDCCLFMPMYTAPVQIIVLKNSDIQDINDLRGKRVGTMPVGAVGHAVVLNVLQGAGITEEDINSYPIEIIEMCDALKTKTLDAIMINTGVPTSAVMELRATHDVRFISLDPEVAQKGADLSPATFVGTIDANTYEKQDEEIITVLTYAVMVTNKKITENTLYEAVKAIWNDKEYLMNSHASQKGISPKWFTDINECTPLHPGVLKFAKEQGWL